MATNPLASPLSLISEKICSVAQKSKCCPRISTVSDHPSRSLHQAIFAPRLCHGKHTTMTVRATGRNKLSQLLQFGRRKTQDEGEDEDAEAEAEDKESKLASKWMNFAARRGNFTERGGGSISLVVKQDLGGLESLSLGRLRRSDSKTVFVAGATGQMGARISQQLLRNGFSVRGGVRDLFFAQQLAEFATQYGVISKDEARRLNAVEFDFKDVESIAKAVGNAGKIVVTVGPAEDGPQAKVTPSDALRVVEAAKLANVGHLVVVSEAGSGVVGSGLLAGISAFFSDLFKKGSEFSTEDLIDGIVESDLTFTFIRTSSTEGIDDYSPDTDNLVLLTEGIPDEGRGKVSKAQIASVVTGVFLNRAVSENKVVELATRDYAPITPIDELLRAIPTDGRRTALQESRAKAETEEREMEARARAEKEAREALEEARKAAELAYELEQEAKRLAAEEAKAAVAAERAKMKAQEAAASLDTLDVKGKALLDTLNIRGSNVGDLLSKTISGFPASKRKIEIGSFLPKKGAIKGALSPNKNSPAAATASPSTQTLNIFGSLFKQETIYVDED